MAILKRDSSGDVEGVTKLGWFTFIFGVIGLIVLIRLLTCFVSVGVGQVGIVTRYGRVMGEVQSGLHFIPPWEALTQMNVQVQKSQVDATAATQDLQSVTTTVAVNYHLTPTTANQVYREVGTNYVGTIVDPIVQETFKAVSAKYNATDLVTERAAVQAQTLSDLQNAFQARGITVDNLNIVNFAFSQQYTDAIEAKQVASQNVQTQQYNLQASQLQAQAQEQQKTSLSPQYLELQAIQKWDGKMPNTVAGGSGNIFGIQLQQ